MAREYPRSLPSVYAEEKRAETLRRWNGELGRWVREYTPRVLPGCPPSAVMGFASNASGDEQTSLDELGFFGIERIEGWRRLAQSATARELLGGVASDTWRASEGGTRAQVALGLANLLEDGRVLQAALGTSEPTGSLWGVACSFASWSAGSGSAARNLAPYAAAFPSWERLCRDVAAALSSGRVAPGPAFSHSANVAYTLTRTRQKLATGALLESDVGGSLAWYAGEFPADVASIEDVLARAGSGASLTGSPLGGGLGLLSAAAALALGAAAVYGFRAYSHRRKR